MPPFRFQFGFTIHSNIKLGLNRSVGCQVGAVDIRHVVSRFFGVYRIGAKVGCRRAEVCIYLLYSREAY